MGSVSNAVPIAEFFRNNPQAKQVFDAIARAQTISGWALTKQTGLDPDSLRSVLSELQSRGLINGDGAASDSLDSFFYLTGLGFQYGSVAS